MFHEFPNLVKKTKNLNFCVPGHTASQVQTIISLPPLPSYVRPQQMPLKKVPFHRWMKNVYHLPLTRHPLYRSVTRVILPRPAACRIISSLRVSAPSCCIMRGRPSCLALPFLRPEVAAERSSIFKPQNCPCYHRTSATALKGMHSTLRMWRFSALYSKLT